MINLNLLKSAAKTDDKLKIHMDRPNFINEGSAFITAKVREIDKTLQRTVVTLCIGTDRSTGDCLGPLVGWLLQERLPLSNFVYGTIDRPVHATNMPDALKEIKQRYSDPLIIAIDACLGKMDSVGYVSFAQGSLKPGAAVNKNLPAIGDIAISGIVNVGGFMEYFVLQNTRLSFVMQMAEKIAQVLAEVYCSNLSLTKTK
ncbi:MAG: spore protease YyaC [Peptococcaceae bacterium]